MTGVVMKDIAGSSYAASGQRSVALSTVSAPGETIRTRQRTTHLS